METRLQETPISAPIFEEASTPKDRRDDFTTGLALIGFGLFFLAARFLDIGLLVLPLLGFVLTVWGIASRHAGLLVPGGILSGIGVGAFLITGPFQFVGDNAEGGIFMLSFAAGWFSITVLSKLFTREPQWWALIPGAIMALIGSGILLGGVALYLLEFAGAYWPAALIAVGLYTLARRNR